MSWTGWFTRGSLRAAALIEGVQYRNKGVKHSIGDRQAWWAEPPPRTHPLLDHQAYILARERLWRRQIEVGWGDG